MTEFKRIHTPLTDDAVVSLRAGDNLLISGSIYTGRDAAHKRLVDLITSGKELPFDMNGQIIYYVGPSPARPGRVIGSAGPTTSGRMDAYSSLLLKHGLKGMIGKGSRSLQVREAMKEFKGVYMAATGGAAALLTRSIKSMDLVAYEDLGPEAIRILHVEDFPVVVVNDVFGNDLYETGMKHYQRQS